jgi:hypothetical protein
MLYFTFSVLVLAALLFFPVTKIIWVLSVRRLQRRTGTQLSESETHGQLVRARFIAVFTSLLFSFLFNLNLLGWPQHG